MPWYYCYAHHGPGHQGMTECLVWQSGKLSRREKESLFSDLFNGYEYPIGDVKLVKTLTEKEKEQEVSRFKSELAYAHEMLSILKRTPTQKALRPRQRKEEKRRRQTRQWIEENHGKNNKLVDIAMAKTNRSKSPKRSLTK